MTFEEYIKNPMGSSVMSNRHMYDTMYKEKWDTIKVRENGKITYFLFKGKDDYYAHFKIPSEIVPNFYYDTIVRFYKPKGKASVKSTSLNDFDVQFYSNDPSFVYTFVYAFNKRGMFINDLENKMSKYALKHIASEKNPKAELGYVKSLYFLYLEMKQLNLFNVSRWQTASTYTKHTWNTVEHADDKIKDRQDKASESSDKKRPQRSSTYKSTESQKKGLVSPNIPNFGHFKKTISNSISKPNKGIGRFKKSK